IVTIFLSHVVDQRDWLVRRIDNRTLVNSHDHAVRRDRFRLFEFPMRGDSISSERDEFSVRGHLVSLRRGNAERNSGLCRRMIERRDPVMNSIRPVVAGGGFVAIAILCEDEAISWMAMIADRDSKFVVAFR